MRTTAVVLAEPERLGLDELALVPGAGEDLVVETRWSAISTGTEKLLWSGRMPHFPGMGYPLVPGYEAVGHVVRAAGPFAEGDAVFVPGARCFGSVRGLFGAAASRLATVPGRAIRVDAALGGDAVLLSLAATAHHALHDRGRVALPDLVVGNGVLGRLCARLTRALRAAAGDEAEAPVVHEIEPARRRDAAGIDAIDPEADPRRNYARVLDASGADGTLDRAIGRIAKGGEVVLAGFYERPLSMAFPPAFMREARIRVAAEFGPDDLAAVSRLIGEGHLSLGGLVTHTQSAAEAPAAYETAFTDPACLKMTLDWKDAT